MILQWYQDKTRARMSLHDELLDLTSGTLATPPIVELENLDTSGALPFAPEYPDFEP